MNNQGGAPTFRTFTLVVSGSYNIIDDPTGEHTLVTGVQLGYMNKNFRTSEYYFDSQYSSSTGGFESSISSGETFGSTSINRFDAGMGVFYRYRPTGKKYSPYGGFSMGHVSFPNQSFYGEKEPLPIIWRINAGTDFVLKEQFELRPVLLMMFQKRAYEFLLNVNGIYKLKNEDYDIRALLGYRIKDAVVLGAGMRYKEFILKLSYDINASYMTNYTHGRGGFEIGLSYQGQYRNEKIRKVFSPKI